MGCEIATFIRPEGPADRRPITRGQRIGRVVRVVVLTAIVMLFVSLVVIDKLGG